MTWGRESVSASAGMRPPLCREGLVLPSIQLPGSIQPVRTKYHHGVSAFGFCGAAKIAIGEMDAPRGTIGSAHQDGQPRGRYIDGLRVRSRHFDGTGLGRSLRRPGSSSWCSGHDNRHGHGAGASDLLLGGIGTIGVASWRRSSSCCDWTIRSLVATRAPHRKRGSFCRLETLCDQGECRRSSAVEQLIRNQ